MKFARGSVVASLISACLPLAVACGSASNSDLFSPSGGQSSGAHAGASNASAGANTAGSNADGTSGANNGSSGNTSTGDAGGGNNGTSGAPTGGKRGNGEAGAPGAGAGGAPSAGAPGTPAAGSGAAAAAGAGGAPATGSGGAAAAGAGAAGAPAGGASSCPVLSPKEGLVCAVHTPDSCFYSGSACSCLSNNNGPGNGGTSKRWGCYGSANSCPDSKPTAGVSCKQDIGAGCPYPDHDFCACVGNFQEAKWVCQAEPVMCPAQKPPDGQACSAVRTCQYADVACFCNADQWSCLGG